MPDEPTQVDLFTAMQQQAVEMTVRQIIAAGRPPGGHIKDSLGLLERIIAQVVAASGGPEDDEVTLNEIMGSVLTRIASIRNPATA